MLSAEEVSRLRSEHFLSARVEDGIGDACRLYGYFYVVRSQDVRPLENQGGVCGKICVKPVRGGSVFSIFRQGTPEERFSRRSSHQRKTQRLQFLKAGQQWIILLEVLAEAKARIERDPFPVHARQDGRFRPFPEFTLDQQNNIAGRRQGAPFSGAAAHVRQSGEREERTDA